MSRDALREIVEEMRTYMAGNLHALPDVDDYVGDWLARLAAIASPPAAVAVTAADEYEFQVWQNDECQASGSAESLVSVAAEAAHYAAMYGQDGPVEVRYYARHAIDIEAALTTSSAQSAGGLDG